MKKTVLAIAVLLVGCSTAQAQDITKAADEKSLLTLISRAAVIVVLLYLAGSFIISLAQRILDHRLKNKMIDKGVPESIMNHLLQTNRQDPKQVAARWIAILTGLGTGLALSSLFQPYGIHSITIIIFSLTASMLIYYYYLRRPR